MAKIALSKVISDVKDVYVETTGLSDRLTYGNIDDKLRTAITSGIGMKRDGGITKPLIVCVTKEVSISDVEVSVNV